MIKNEIEFALRRFLTWSPGVNAPDPRDSRLAAEVGELLRGFAWAEALADQRGNTLTIADVGAKNFFLAPELARWAREMGMEAQIHGFELDAFQRYSNLRTRAAYGQFYAEQAGDARFHALDFAESEQRFDLVLLLNPFVTLTPHVRWGLPRSRFDPGRLFERIGGSLRPGGLLLLSSPTEPELAEALRLSAAIGLRPAQASDWLPRPGSLQRQPRYGRLLARG